MNYNEEFVYDDSRIYAKIYIFFKFLGIIFYSVSLPTCYNPYFYISMIVVMFLSMMNSVRYEYAHFKRYGTIFSSLNEYRTWKKELLPKSKMFFATIELSIKTAYFIKIFPPQFDYNNLCEIGESIFKIHILVLLSIYVISIIISIFILCIIYSNSRPVIQLPNITNQTEECCICLDMDNTLVWSILPCGHKFHRTCISTWLCSHQTCPVCRFRVISIQ